jgi:hypothetical protein
MFAETVGTRVFTVEGAEMAGVADSANSEK